MRIARGAGFVLAVGVCASAWPLLTYTLSLALFGLAHVLAELRYVDARFAARLRGRVGLALGLLLVGVVGLRAGGASGLVPAGVRTPLELLLVAGLVVAVVPLLARRSTTWAAAGVALIVLLSLGVWTAPLLTLLALAVLHNLTPIGFLAERLRGAARRRAMFACLAAFGVAPLVIASGWPAQALASLAAPQASLLPVGPLTDHLGVFVPPALHQHSAAVPLFSAAVFLQCLHYAVVLHVLPRLDDAGSWTPPESLVPWPERPAFTLALGAAGGLLFLAFAWSFQEARALYGVAAAVHAWVELPVLLVGAAVPAVAAEVAA